MTRRDKITVGVSGGSGAIYAVRLIPILAAWYQRVDVVLSTAARQVMRQEVNVVLPDAGAWEQPDAPDSDVIVWGLHDYSAPFASGSNAPRQMVIVPCSMSTAASVAHGVDQNLLHHAAGVIIKEGRSLVVVPRESPLSAIHLRNLLALAELGVKVVAAMPGFYSGQATFDDLVNFVLQKIVNALDLDLTISRRWGATTEQR